MNNQKDIIDCYNKTTANYAEKFINELDHKHFDRILLSAFAAENGNKGTMIDIGCGPGQATKFLSDCGVQQILGIDISPAMIAMAKSIHPMPGFEVGDMLTLQYADKSFASAIAFYSIVHFNEEQLITAFKEIKRVLIDKGQFLFSFHIGDTILHQSEFLGQPVNVDFCFFETGKMIGLLEQAGFHIIDVMEREPYAGVEYASKRAYIWVATTKEAH